MAAKTAEEAAEEKRMLTPKLLKMKAADADVKRKNAPKMLPANVTGKIVTTSNLHQNDASGIRLKEILGVLKKHHITSGIQPEKLRLILEDLGPTYVKLGQIMSMRSDMLPEAYCKELERLRTDVKPLSFDVIKEVIEEQLGCPAEEIFTEISPIPLGSASIAQVHPAVLKNGERVVIKVQQPPHP